MRALHTLLPTHGFKQKCDLTSGTLKWSTETHFVLKCSCESWCQKGAAKHLGACLSAVPDRTGLGGQSFLSATNRGFLLGLLLCHNILIITLVSGEFRKLVTSLSISDSASIPADSTKLTVDLKKEFWDSCSFFFFAFELVGFFGGIFFFSYFEIFFFLQFGSQQLVILFPKHCCEEFPLLVTWLWPPHCKLSSISSSLSMQGAACSQKWAQFRGGPEIIYPEIDLSVFI